MQENAYIFRKYTGNAPNLHKMQENALKYLIFNEK